LKYGVEEVLHHDELASWLEARGVAKRQANRDENAAEGGLSSSAPDDGNRVATAAHVAETTTTAALRQPKLHLLWGQNSDSGNWAMPALVPSEDGRPDKWAVDRETLFPCLAEARVVKSDAEVSGIIKCACGNVTCAACV
jgi:hypothetical protein